MASDVELLDSACLVPDTYISLGFVMEMNVWFWDCLPSISNTDMFYPGARTWNIQIGPLICVLHKSAHYPNSAAFELLVMT